jgi:PST family polysaccharide transporter
MVRVPRADVTPPSDIIDHKKLDRAFAGGLAWTAGAKWLAQIVTWASLLIIARLLAPSDFGLVAMTTVYFGLMNVLAEFGIGQAVVNLRELQRPVLAQLNTICFLIGIVSFGFSAAVAPLVAAFFRSPQLVPVLIVTSLGFFTTALRIVQTGVIQRGMNYRLLSLIDAVQFIVQALSSVALAALGFGYWSLVFGGLAGTAAAAALAIASVKVSYATPRLQEIRTALGFGSHIVAARIAWYSYSRADVIVGGRVLGQGPLGVYTLATNIASLPGEKITTTIMRVTGPLFARVQDDRAALRRYLLIATESISFLTFPAVVGLASVADLLVAVALGDKWAGVVAPLRWLTFYTGFRTINSFIHQALTALRQTAFTMHVSFLTLAVMPVAFYIGSYWGTAGIAAAWTFVFPFTTIPLYVRLFRLIQLRPSEYLSAIAPSLAGAIPMAACLLAVGRVLPSEWPALVRLLVEVAAGAGIYSAILFVAFRDRLRRYLDFLKSLKKQG